MRTVLLPLTIALLIACTSDKKNLTNASGPVGDVYVVMDSAQRKGQIGIILDSILGADMPGLPRKESIFKIHWVDARRLNYLLKERRNMVYVLTLDQRSQGSAIIRGLFTPESIEKIKSDPTQYIRTASNVFSRGQEIIYLFGKDEQTLIKNLRANGHRMVSYFDQKESERMSQSLFKAGRMKGISDILVKEFQCDIKIPFGYKLADKGKDFLWVRQINPRDDKDVFIARKPYASQDQFKKENLIRFRDDICRQYLFEDPAQPDTYLLTETSIPFVPVTADTINFKGHFALQLRGLWRTNTLGMGGPFTGIALVDEYSRQFYYIEGFTFSPGKSQREIMRELETILFTFKTNREIDASEIPSK